MKKFTQKLYQEAQLELKNISSTGAVGFELYNACFRVLRDAFRKLKIFTHKHKFRDQDEEIEFFKEIKPGFQSQLMYFIEMIQIEVRKPTVSERKELVKYYRKVSRHYQSMVEKNRLFMHYMRTGLTSGDHLLFVCSAEAEQMLHTDILDLDDKFSTPASTELARIRAYEMVIEHLGEQVEALKSGNATPNVVPYETIWTGSKVALIELAYALHSAKVINHGRVDIKHIISALESVFKIDLGNFYRVFLNIRIRQGNRTAFMDELKEKVTERMDEADMSG